MDYQPDAPLDDAAPALTEGVEHAHTCWNAVLGEAARALHVTLEELAVLAGLSTAAIDATAGSPADSASRSPYSLLLEPGLFRFRS